ncbi:MAG: L-histidine N(alpha)-methyltransferase [bacterium]
MLHSFAQQIRTGLGQPTGKWLPSGLSYHGDNLFPQIAAMDAYYQGRAELKILKTHSPALAARVVEESQLFNCTSLLVTELGCCTGGKTRYVLEALAAKGLPIDYVGADFSADSLAAFRQHPPYPIGGTNGFRLIEGCGMEALAALRLNNRQYRVHLDLGGSVGNGDPVQNVAYMASLLKIGDAMLVGYHSRSPGDPRILAAYNDPGGITAAFIWNALQQVNEQYGGSFRRENFDYRPWIDDEGTVHMDMVSRRRHTVRINDLDIAVEIDKNEPITISRSKKWYEPDFRALLCRHQLVTVKSFSDPENLCSLVVAIKD